jgi:hypothetical protein
MVLIFLSAFIVTQKTEKSKCRRNLPPHSPLLYNAGVFLLSLRGRAMRGRGRVKQSFCHSEPRAHRGVKNLPGYAWVYLKCAQAKLGRSFAPTKSVGTQDDIKSGINISTFGLLAMTMGEMANQSKGNIKNSWIVSRSFFEKF